MEKMTAAILCGGKSSRMGFDKSLMLIEGQFVLASLAAQLQQDFDEVLLITNELEKLAGISSLKRYRIMTDEYPNCGPLAGIYTSLLGAKNPRVFVMGCDMPVVDLAFISKMRAARGHDIVLPRHGDFIEPLYAIYSKQCMEEFKLRIERGDLAVRAGFDGLNVLEVDASGYEEIFVNLNRPQDLNGVEKYFGKSKKNGKPNARTK